MKPENLSPGHGCSCFVMYIWPVLRFLYRVSYLYVSDASSSLTASGSNSLAVVLEDPKTWDYETVLCQSIVANTQIGTL